MKRRALSLALAMTWWVAGVWVFAQQPGPLPGEAVMPPPGQPGEVPMPEGVPPGAIHPGAMMPGGMMPGAPPGYAPPGYMAYPNPYGAAMQGGYPGMPGVAPYAGGDGCCGGPYGGMPYEGCGDGCCGCGEECCGCDAFGRHGGCGGCDEGCCGDGTPHWRARVEALYMNFDLPHQPALLTTSLAGASLLNIGSLDFDYELAGRLTLEARVNGDNSLELSFLGMPRWTSSASVTATNGLNSAYQQLNGAAVVPYDGGDQQDISYRSDFFNVEANYWMPIVNHRLIQASFMLGGRYLRVDERFIYTGINVAGANTIVGVTDINTLNDVFATQVGMMCWVPLSHKVSAKIDAKAGAGYNFAEQSTSINVTGSNVAAQNITYAENVETNKGSFLTELSGVVVTQINCNVGFYVGYQAMWLDELVLAPEQFNPIFPTNGVRPVLIDDTGHRLYHGAIAGLEFTW